MPEPAIPPDLEKLLKGRQVSDLDKFAMKAFYVFIVLFIIAVLFGISNRVSINRQFEEEKSKFEKECDKVGTSLETLKGGGKFLKTVYKCGEDIHIR